MTRQGNWTFPIRMAALGAALACLALAGCGGSSSPGDAAKVLDQTFGQSHTVKSGQLTFDLVVAPSGSAALRTPITISLGGPFQSLGAGKLPQSNFTLSIAALGRSISLGILSTGTAGYVSFQGTSYPLPQADFQKLESSFASLASSPGGGRGSGLLGKLGIHPLTWLRNPTVVGTETVAGASTTHVHAGINVSVLLHDFNTFLGKASGLGVTGAASFPSGLSDATIGRLTSEIQNPSFDLWTGSSDRTIRKLLVSLSAPMPSSLSTLLGPRASLALTMQYADLNQPQTITAPTTTAPFSQFTAKIKAFVGGLLGGGLLGSGSSSSGSGTSTTGGSSASSLNAYAQCIQAAGNDVGKIQQCAPLLGGGG
jgi:hypothetical protein